MKVVIVGCGRMGSELARSLNDNKNDVIVIDSNPDSFKLLGNSFVGITVAGIGFDKDVLEKAGVDRVDALVACTSNDETNALVARIASNIYRVPKVIARLFDPRKATVYDMLGIQTISTTTWGIRRAMQLLDYRQLNSVLTIGNGEVEVIRSDVPTLLIGKKIEDMGNDFLDTRVISIYRNNHAFLPTHNTVFEKGDVMFITVLNSSLDKLKKRLGL